MRKFADKKSANNGRRLYLHKVDVTVLGTLRHVSMTRRVDPCLEKMGRDFHEGKFYQRGCDDSEQKSSTDSSNG
jgi:hypothetical protein